MLLISIPEQEKDKKVNKELEDPRDNDENNQPFSAKKYHPF